MVVFPLSLLMLLSVSNCWGPQAKDENAAMTWTIRFVGLVIIWIGGCCCLMPLAKLSSLFGTCLGELAETAICCITAPVAFFITLTTIAVGWIAYRPMVAYPLLGAAVVFVIVSCTQI